MTFRKDSFFHDLIFFARPALTVWLRAPGMIKGTVIAGFSYSNIVIPKMPTFWLFGSVIEASVLPAGIW